MSPTHPLSRNLDAYNAYHALVSLWAWIPIFYFYLTQFLPLQDVVRLQAIYYAAVVAMEVPSGYFSDRLGRRLTLVLASSFLVASYGMFILVDSFAGFVVAEVLLAAGFAFQSGTDTALLYDSLKELGRDSEYLEREARSQRYAMSAAALAALIGGVTGWIDLRLAYVLSLLGALGSWFLAYRFVEPSRSGHTAGFAKQLRLCVECLKQPLLLWLFAFFVVMYALEHIPFEFYQPYIQLLDASFRGLLEGPPISGAVIAVSMFGGAFGAALSARLHSRLGLLAMLVGAYLIQCLIIGALASVLHVAALSVIALRNFPMALVRAPVYAVIAPHVATEQRATYLSLQSLSGRLAFSLVLLAISLQIPTGRVMTWGDLSTILLRCLVVAVVALFVLIVLSKPARE